MSSIQQGRCSILLENPRAGAGAPQTEMPGFPVAHFPWNAMSVELLDCRFAAEEVWEPDYGHICVLTP